METQILNDENNVRREPIVDISPEGSERRDRDERLGRDIDRDRNRDFDRDRNRDFDRDRRENRRRYERCDYRTVRLLRHLLSGRDGELTNIGALFYGYMLFRDDDNFSSTLRRMAMNNMNQAYSLGENMMLFGGTPRFTNGQGAFWSTRAINYATNRGLYINNTIRLMQRVIREYNRAINRTMDPSLQNFFRNIISEHERDIETLRNLF